MNLLSIGAALGIMTAAFQFGWGKSFLGFTRAGPIEVFVPVLMFAILFGLSMDYEVFLVSRMHEEWVRTGDNEQAVIRGQAETGRVITAAALIMILVFVSFIFGGEIVIKEVGLGFSRRPSSWTPSSFGPCWSPRSCTCSGRANWWLPGWLDRILPTRPRGGRRTSSRPVPAQRRSAPDSISRELARHGLARHEEATSHALHPE